MKVKKVLLKSRTNTDGYWWATCGNINIGYIIEYEQGFDWSLDPPFELEHVDESDGESKTLEEAFEKLKESFNQYLSAFLTDGKNPFA